MEEGGYAANGIKHCVRPMDMSGGRAVRVAGCGLPLLLGKGNLPSLWCTSAGVLCRAPASFTVAHTHFVAQARAPA